MKRGGRGGGCFSNKFNCRKYATNGVEKHGLFLIETKNHLFRIMQESFWNNYFLEMCKTWNPRDQTIFALTLFRNFGSRNCGCDVNNPCSIIGIIELVDCHIACGKHVKSIKIINGNQNRRRQNKWNNNFLMAKWLCLVRSIWREQKKVLDGQKNKKWFVMCLNNLIFRSDLPKW